MPENQGSKRYDTAKYENMSNEELEEILQLDTEVGECEELDADEILCILEVLAERDAVCEDKSAQQAWESFCKNYMPENQKRDNFSKGVRRSTRRWIALAASVAIVICISVVGGAVGWGRISGAVANWTKDFFSFSKIEEEDPFTAYKFETNNPGLQQLYDTVVAEGITDPVVPMWLPEGYELAEIKEESFPEGSKISAIFVNKDNWVLLIYTTGSNISPHLYEKKDSEAEVYEFNGITHYILENKDKKSGVWMQKKAECLLSTNLDKTMLSKIIASIYEME